MPAATQDFDTFQAYLNAPSLSAIIDPIGYWNALLTSEHDGLLVCMALDFLSIPDTFLNHFLLILTANFQIWQQPL